MLSRRGMGLVRVFPVAGDLLLISPDFSHAYEPSSVTAVVGGQAGWLSAAGTLVIFGLGAGAMSDEAPRDRLLRSEHLAAGPAGDPSFGRKAPPLGDRRTHLFDNGIDESVG